MTRVLKILAELRELSEQVEALLERALIEVEREQDTNALDSGIALGALTEKLN